MQSTIKPIVVVTSDGQPQPGQLHRSSHNFSLAGAPPGTAQLQFVVTDHPNYACITFDVLLDVSAWPDRTIWPSVGNNDVRDVQDVPSFYIANPKNTAGQPFTVQIWRVS